MPYWLVVHFVRRQQEQMVVVLPFSNCHYHQIVEHNFIAETDHLLGCFSMA
jgi:hypothetical protein